MTKNLHTKILIVLLLCFVIAIVAFACTPRSTTVVPVDPGKPGGSDEFDVTGGVKTDTTVSEIFAYMKDVLAVDDENDYVAFKFVSDNVTVVESGKKFEMFASVLCKYNRRDDSKTELSIEFHSSATRSVVLGFYY